MTTTPDGTDAPEPNTTPFATPPAPPSPAEQPKRKRRWLLPTLIGVFAFVLGVGAGAAGGKADTAAPVEPEPATTVTVTATVPGEVPQDQLDALAARESELDQREADLDAREAALAEQEQPDTVAPPPAESADECHPSYEPCLPIVSDVDCEGGSGDGPVYTGPVRVIGPDEYDLDRDGDGVGCD